jgi:hypothetical protein
MALMFQIMASVERTNACWVLHPKGPAVFTKLLLHRELHLPHSIFRLDLGDVVVLLFHGPFAAVLRLAR